jgi:hypothetical protein
MFLIAHRRGLQRKRCALHPQGLVVWLNTHFGEFVLVVKVWRAAKAKGEREKAHAALLGATQSLRRARAPGCLARRRGRVMDHQAVCGAQVFPRFLVSEYTAFAHSLFASICALNAPNNSAFAAQSGHQRHRERAGHLCFTFLVFILISKLLHSANQLFLRGFLQSN